MEKFNSLFKNFLNVFKSISNTSTNKYNDIRDFLCEKLDLEADGIYITGAKQRISNLDTRLAQGNQRNQHTPLGVAFISISTSGRSRESAIDTARNSFKNTVSKFVSGEERGTNFDGVIGFIQLDEEDFVTPLIFLYSQNCFFKEKIFDYFHEYRIYNHLINKMSSPGLADVNQGRNTSMVKVQADSATLDSSLISSFYDSLTDAGLIFNKDMLSRFVASLLVKRFVILAGLSGSGKTKLAICFAEWIKEFDEQLKVVSVGADWNGTENVFGYRDALDPSRFVKPVSGILDILINAEQDPSRPYFLILDEMNLSHVERYFSDFLSAMESESEIDLHTSQDLIDDVPPSIELPKNLFIVGTVNVDETTYMFSPKVLDRANVIEFKVEEDELMNFFNNPKKVNIKTIVGLGQQYQSAIVESAKISDVTFLSITSNNSDEASKVEGEVTEVLLQAFKIFKKIGAEFGFRSANEVLRFLYFHSKLEGDAWELYVSLDAQMVQKLMPKLHGSDRRLRPVLDALSELCNKYNLKVSQEKISRMQDRLNDGFTSFLE